MTCHCGQRHLSPVEFFVTYTADGKTGTEIVAATTAAGALQRINRRRAAQGWGKATATEIRERDAGGVWRVIA